MSNVDREQVPSNCRTCNVFHRGSQLEQVVDCIPGHYTGLYSMRVWYCESYAGHKLLFSGAQLCRLNEDDSPRLRSLLSQLIHGQLGLHYFGLYNSAPVGDCGLYLHIRRSWRNRDLSAGVATPGGR